MPDVPKIILPDLSCSADVVRHHAQVRPEAVALVFQDESITYAELDALSSRCANALIAAGVRPGDRVGTYFALRIYPSQKNRSRRWGGWGR